MIEPQDLPALKKLCEAAEENWLSDIHRSLNQPYQQRRPIEQFIAAARTAMPKLIEFIEKLQDKLCEVKNESIDFAVKADDRAKENQSLRELLNETKDFIHCELGRGSNCDCPESKILAHIDAALRDNRA